MNNKVLVLLVFSVLVAGCLQNGSVDPEKASEKLAQSVAEKYVMNMSEYRDNNGRNLTLVSMNVSRMRYSPESAVVFTRVFTYEFDMDSEKREGAVDTVTVVLTLRERDIIEVVSHAGLKVEPVTRYGALAVSSLLEKPRYGVEVAIYGRVSGLGELLCPCLQLSSEGRTLTVWYDLMDDNGEMRPKVNVSGMVNGDIVKVSGELRSIVDGEATFWASAIENVEETEESNPAGSGDDESVDGETTGSPEDPEGETLEETDPQVPGESDDGEPAAVTGDSGDTPGESVDDVVMDEAVESLTVKDVAAGQDTESEDPGVSTKSKPEPSDPAEEEIIVDTFAVVD